jgi:hypothetical protein
MAACLWHALVGKDARAPGEEVAFIGKALYAKAKKTLAGGVC